jgi:hypothetical protein
MLRAVLVVFAVLSSSVASAAPDLSGFAAIPRDPPPVETTRGQHYWIGNEDRLDLFYGEIKGKAGIHMGVGAEQNWLLCGWSRCDMLVLMDFDQAIVDLHRVYIAAFATAATRAEFMEVWLDKKRTALRAAIVARYTGTDRAGALHALDVARWSVERRFAKLDKQMSAHALSTFFTNDDDYRHLRQLVLDGRVVAVRGDLTAKQTVLAIGAAAKQAALSVRTLYLSNAEQYFNYNVQTRKNLTSLPMDESSVVLRTHGSRALGYVKDGNSYHYGVQTGPSFQALLQSPLVTSSHQILLWADSNGEKGWSRQTSTNADAVRAAWLKNRPAPKKH